jgi:yeast amino acid transporter
MAAWLNLNLYLQTMGWNYWYNWTIALPAELSAAAVLINFWDKNTKVNSAWVTMCLLVVVAINFMGAGKSREFVKASSKRHTPDPTKPFSVLL